MKPWPGWGSPAKKKWGWGGQPNKNLTETHLNMGGCSPLQVRQALTSGASWCSSLLHHHCRHCQRLDHPAWRSAACTRVKRPIGQAFAYDKFYLAKVCLSLRPGLCQMFVLFCKGLFNQSVRIANLVWKKGTSVKEETRGSPPFLKTKIPSEMEVAPLHNPFGP